MSGSTDRFKHESLEDTDSIVKYMEALRDGLQKRALRFQADEKSLEVKPNGLINLELEARRKGHDIKLTIKLRWSETSPVEEAKSKSLKIGPEHGG